MTPSTQLHANSTSLALAFITPKGKTEFNLLMGLRMACLVARSGNLSANAKVQARLNEIKDYLHYHQPSQAFHQRFVLGRSEICTGIRLHIDADGIATVEPALTPNKNVIALVGDRHAANH